MTTTTMSSVFNFRKTSRITPRLTDQERCPECSHSFAVVDMRQISKSSRVCCLCALKLRDRKQEPHRATALWIGLGFTLICYFVCMVWDPFGLSKKLPRAQAAQAVAALAAAGKEVRAAQPRPVAGLQALTLEGDSLFEIGRSNFKEGASASLEKLAVFIRQNPSSKATIRAFTDSVGTDKENRLLSRQRAETIRSWLVRKGGIQEARLAIEGMGSRDPVAPNANANGSDNSAGRAQNRRVTVTLTSKQAVNRARKPETRKV